MQSYGLMPGSAGPVENGNPLQNVFARIDLALPSLNSRASAWTNYSGNDNITFSRASRDTFSLSTLQVTNVAKSHLSGLQLHTTLPHTGGGENDVLIYARTESLDALSDFPQPIIRVSVPGTSGAPTTLNTGTPENAQGPGFRSSTRGLKDDLSLALGSSNVLTVGAAAEAFRLVKGSLANSYGIWSFGSLDNFQLGIPDRYQVGTTVPGGSTPLTGGQYAVYVSDQWQPVGPSLHHSGNSRRLSGDRRPRSLQLRGRFDIRPADRSDAAATHRARSARGICLERLP
jgi:hypothetical protein